MDVSVIFIILLAAPGSMSSTPEKSLTADKGPECVSIWGFHGKRLVSGLKLARRVGSLPQPMPEDVTPVEFICKTLKE